MCSLSATKFTIQVKSPMKNVNYTYKHREKNNKKQNKHTSKQKKQKSYNKKFEAD